MTKRKRNPSSDSAGTIPDLPSKKPKSSTESASQSPITIQIIAGSYDRVLHGITATIPSQSSSPVQFSDTFLFNAHTTSIRCLALSPPSAPTPNNPTQKIILASGSTDERINLYHLSAHAPSHSHTKVPVIPTLTKHAAVENPTNKELGSLLHHSSSITALYFPTRGKLLSASEDSTIAVTRTRDWSLLSTIKVPIPKAVGRPSGDTAPAGGAPRGVNSFAVHPSLKVMLSVSKGEKCMRLWNLVTGKKAGVLSFSRDVLEEVGEGRYSSGEGRKVVWGASGEEDGEEKEEFAVGFERGGVVFGMDSLARCKVIPEPRSKIHQLGYVKVTKEREAQVLAVSTEDGRLCFFSTRNEDLITPPPTLEGKEAPLPAAKLIAQLGGKDAGLEGRIKDFKILPTTTESKGEGAIVVTASSDGAVRLFRISPSEDLISSKGEDRSEKARQIGSLLGTYETGNRITCLEAFVMLPQIEGGGEEEEFEGLEEDEDEDEDGEEENSSDDSE
jgi:protein MAK11